MLKTKFRTNLVLVTLFVLIFGAIIALGPDALECTADVVLSSQSTR